MNFSIGDPTQFTFTIEVDENGKLTELTASDGSMSYDCKIQLTSSVDANDKKCCGTEGCTSGAC